MAREEMVAPCRLEQPHRSSSVRVVRSARLDRSLGLLMPEQCCSLHCVSAARLDSGFSLQCSQAICQKLSRPISESMTAMQKLRWSLKSSRACWADSKWNLFSACSQVMNS